MVIFDLFGKKKAVTNKNYSIEYSLHPFSLKPQKNDFLLLSIEVTNNNNQPMLTSLVATTSKRLGFEANILSNQKEIRLGVLDPGETRNINLKVWSSPRTIAGSYPIILTAIAHYRDYGHILNESRKKVIVRVA